jgi:hypothetical protein
MGKKTKAERPTPKTDPRFKELRKIRRMIDQRNEAIDRMTAERNELWREMRADGARPADMAVASGVADTFVSRETLRK